MKARLHQVILCGAALAHSGTLLRLAIRDSRVIIDFVRADRTFPNPARAPGCLRTIISPLLQCTRLFRAIPPADSLLGTKPQLAGAKRLASVHEAACHVARLPNRTLTTPLGRRCQALSVQRCFFRLFKIRISFAEADSLAYQSNAASIIQGCIRSSGYPSLIPSPGDMKAAIRAQIRLAPSAERRIRARDLVLSSLQEQIRLFRNLGPRIKARILRAYWRWVDMTEHHFERKSFLLARNMLLQDVLHAADESARQEQSSLRAVLALQIHHQAIMAMCKLDHDLGGVSDTAFQDSFHLLSANFKQCLNIHEKPTKP